MRRKHTGGGTPARTPAGLLLLPSHRVDPSTLCEMGIYAAGWRVLNAVTLGNCRAYGSDPRYRSTVSDPHEARSDPLSSAATTAIPTWDAAARTTTVSNPALQEFRDEMAQSLAGTNAGPSKLHYYVSRELPAIVSTFEVRASDYGTARARRDVYEEQPWGPWRHQVEVALDGLETVVYATLDWGRTTGTKRYGAYRLTFQPVGGRLALIFPHNTALRYGCMDPTDARRAMLEEVAAWSSRGDVAACQLSAYVTADKSTWPALLVNEREYDGHPTHHSLGKVDLLEVVCRDGEIPLTNVVEARIDEEYGRDAEEAIARMLTEVDVNGPFEIDEELLLYLQLSSDASPIKNLHVVPERTETTHNED